MGRSNKRGPPWPLANGKAGSSVKRSKVVATPTATGGVDSTPSEPTVAKDGKHRASDGNYRTQSLRKPKGQKQQQRQQDVQSSGSKVEMVDENGSAVQELVKSTNEDTATRTPAKRTLHDSPASRNEQTGLFVQFSELAALQSRYEVITLRITASIKLRAKITALLEALRSDNDSHEMDEEQDGSIPITKPLTASTMPENHRTYPKPRIVVLQAKGNCPAAGKMISVVEIAKREASRQATRNLSVHAAGNKNTPWYQYTRLDGRLEEWSGEDAKSKRRRHLSQLASGTPPADSTGGRECRTRSTKETGDPCKDVPRESAGSSTSRRDNRSEDGEVSDGGGPTHEVVKSAVASVGKTSHQVGTRGKPGFRTGSDHPGHADEPHRSRRQANADQDQNRKEEGEGDMPKPDSHAQAGCNDAGGDRRAGGPGCDAKGVGGVEAQDEEGMEEQGREDGEVESDSDDAFEYMQASGAGDRGATNSASRLQQQQQQQAGQTADEAEIHGVGGAGKRGVKVRSVPILSIILCRTRIDELEVSIS